jgi:serine/threonine protein kinase
MVPLWYNTVLYQMLDALAFLHSIHVMVVHRDVTPQNILFNSTDRFVLAGFSLARTGTPKLGEYWERRNYKYLAPEVYEERPERTAVDVWALGILCLDMLNILPKVDVDEGPNNFRLFQQLNWCGRMCALASHTGRPEMEKTVVKEAKERGSASLLRQRMRQDQGIRSRSFRPKMSLLYAILREDRSNGHLTNEEIFQYANRFPETHPVMPQHPASARQQPRNLQPTVTQTSARTGAQELADLPVTKLFILGAEMQRLGLDSEIGLRALTGSAQIATSSASARSPPPVTSAQAAAQLRSTTDSPRGRKPGTASSSLDSRTKSSRFGEVNTKAEVKKKAESRATSTKAEAQAKEVKAEAKPTEAKSGAKLIEAKAGAKATEAKAGAKATRTKAGAMGAEVNVAPSKSTSERDSQLGSSSAEQAAGRHETGGQGSIRAPQLANFQPSEARRQSPHVVEILGRRSEAEAKSWPPFSRQLETSSQSKVEQASKPPPRDRERPALPSDSSRQTQSQMKQRQAKGEQPTMLAAPPPHGREASPRRAENRPQSGGKSGAN